jgi:hypothetical protein
LVSSPKRTPTKVSSNAVDMPLKEHPAHPDIVCRSTSGLPRRPIAMHDGYQNPRPRVAPFPERRNRSGAPGSWGTWRHYGKLDAKGMEDCRVIRHRFVIQVIEPIFGLVCVIGAFLQHRRCGLESEVLEACDCTPQLVRRQGSDGVNYTAVHDEPVGQ